MLVGVSREIAEGERRVALAPASLAALKKAKIEVAIERGAGLAAGFLDTAYEAVGARVIETRSELFASADVVVCVRSLGAAGEVWRSDLKLLRSGQIVIGLLDPLTAPAPVAEVAKAGVVAFSLELVPRITRAQSMDVLSSQANVAGYKAALIAADSLSKLFPMMMTAAGTIAASRVLVIGAGVAGLQAIATAKRLGAVVSGYDVRPAVKEQVESLGARFVQLEIDGAAAEGTGGYARAMDADFYKRQADALAKVVADQDVVITTAAVPGQKAPVLVTKAMVEGMQPGSVIVDMAAERGGNCEVTVAGKTIDHNGVSVIGPTNLPSTVAFHASQLYGKNVGTFLLHLIKDGAPVIDLEDEITRETLLTQHGEVVNGRVRQALGLAEPQ